MTDYQSSTNFFLLTHQFISTFGIETSASYLNYGLKVVGKGKQLVAEQGFKGDKEAKQAIPSQNWLS